MELILAGKMFLNLGYEDSGQKEKQPDTKDEIGGEVHRFLLLGCDCPALLNVPGF